jgi:hypothetical protein
MIQRLSAFVSSQREGGEVGCNEESEQVETNSIDTT